MFRKILIANRGEIACRIIETCRRLGISTVAVYSDFDAQARHVALADESVCIGGAPAAQSYLDIDAILAAAHASQAQAIHPGYGFLSENAQFAAACTEAGLVFIGPSPAAIRTMGSKQAAKALLAEAQVPLVPGYHGTEQSIELLQQEAARIGVPLLIKASAGGGGKGMRAVTELDNFQEQLSAAKREAKTAFGDDRVLLEKMILNARHVEVQIFADNHGNVVHLFERDCSLQRRHQKVIEEAPAPGLSNGTRKALGQAAVAAAQAVNYSGAGTVEFILASDQSFYFMEMNTRLQVEHPVTEMITGVDLVEWQLRIAAGEALPHAQSDLEVRGCAIEARLYAENPSKRFLPATGRLNHLELPPPAADLRIDTGVREGDRIGVYYDPMIAKVIAWAETRDLAITRLKRGLADLRISGLITNLSFLQILLEDSQFQQGTMHTQQIDQQLDSLLGHLPTASEEHIALAALAHLTELSHRNAADNPSPWVSCSGWRNLTPQRRRLGLKHAGQRCAVDIESLAQVHQQTHRDGGSQTHLVRINGGRPQTLKLTSRSMTPGTNVISWQKADVSQHLSYYGDDERVELFTPKGTLSFAIEPDYRLSSD